jgi:hypothetical protein
LEWCLTAENPEGRSGDWAEGRPVEISWEAFRKKEMLDIQKMEGSGGSKSEAPIEMEAAAIETMDGTAEDLRRNDKKRQNWVSMR